MEKFVHEKCYEINNLITISGKYTTTEFQKALMDMVNQYILDQQMQTITSAYLVHTKENNQPCVEIYIGINPNVL